MTKPELRWGIIGCGDVVMNKSGPSLLLADSSVICSVMNRNKTKAEKYAQENRIPTWTGDASEIMQDPDIDIVYIATPPDSHQDYTLAAARAGKHVLVEKPMALNSEQAKKMVDVCSDRGVRLFVAYYRRFQPHAEKMHKIIREGEIGRPVQAFIDIGFKMENPGSTWKLDPKISGGGYFVDVGCHRLDLMVSLLGDVVEANGVVSVMDDDSKVEDCVSINLKFKSGCHGSVTADFRSGRNADKFSIFGTRGSLHNEWLDQQKFQLLRDQNRTDYEFEKLAAPHLGLIRHIEDVLLRGGPNRTSGSEALVTENILDTVVRHRL